MSMKLEVGKLYVLRNGEVVGPLSDYGGGDFRFTARNNSGQRLSWRIDGSERLDGGESCEDIVSEYIEPQPEPLRWIENCKPDKPGIWAWVIDDGTLMFEVACLTRPADFAECVTGTWCYLGPMPEILPPKKKVVQRLWLMKLGTSGWPATYDEQWVDDTHPDPEDGNWIRTDETREVEQ